RRGQALEDAQTTRYLRLQAEQGIEFQVRQSINQISDALERRAAAEAAVVQSREQLRLANLRYQTGTGTNTEVLDAESALAQASTSAGNALYDQYAADANYQRATGTEPLAATPIK
nr:TolC family protein [Armatimonadota bacterium]